MKKKIDLLNGNITKSLTALALPLMGMSFLQMAYNLTDVFWIGRLGAGPVASVGTGGLLLWLAMGVYMLAQIGGQVFVGQNLGAKNYKKAADYAYGSIVLCVVIAIILGLTFTLATDPIISFFKLNDPTVVQDAKDYIAITGGLVIFSLLAKLITTLTTVTGDSKTPFIATGIGLVFNMVFDPILIFGLFGFPKLGVIGAAIATVLAQFIVLAVLLFNARKDKTLFCHIKLSHLPKFEIYQKIIKLGLPTTIQSILYPVISMYISRMVAGFGDGAVAVQRVGSQIESISWMTTDGFAIAVNSFIAQNYGAGNVKRAKEGYYKAFKILSCIGVFATLLLIFGAKPIFGIFLSEPQVLAMGASYLVILGFSQWFMCIEILSSSAMNAFSKTFIPAFINIVLTGIRIPLAYILSATALGIDGIWWSISISTIGKGICLFIAIYFVLRNVENFIGYNQDKIEN